MNPEYQSHDEQFDAEMRALFRLEEAGGVVPRGGSPLHQNDRKESLMSDVETLKKRSRGMNRRLWFRDLTELAAAGLVLATALMIARLATAEAVTTFDRVVPLLGVLVLAVCMANALFRLFTHRRPTEIESSEPAKRFLELELETVGRQIALMSSVRSWYVWPIALGGLAWMGSLALVIPGEPGFRLATGGILVVGSVVVLFGVGRVCEVFNRMAVTKLEPYRRELLALVEDLEA